MTTAALPLRVTLRTRTLPGRRIWLRAEARNVGDAPLVLTFSSAQRFEIVATDPTGTPLWRWSADRLFAQMLGEERLAPGEALVLHARWRPPAPGRYRYDVHCLAMELASPETDG